MTRKDYVRLAAALRDARPDTNQPVAAMGAWTRAVISVANSLRGDNSRFDRQRFYRAAGFEEAA